MISYFFFFVSLIFHTLALSTLQRDALLEFKNEFPIVFPDPDPEAPQVGGYLSSWNESSNHCSWEGVTCDGKSGKVTSLVLESFILNASLKSNTSLSKLQYLRELTLTYCELRGEIPSSLANLSHLTNLDLSNNYLVGKIPVSISNLSHLTDLDLSHNYLVGEIPSSVSNLSGLAYLVLDENHLVGEIPPSIGNLNQLISLSLSQNNLSGNIPISFASLTKLSNLDLHQNQFTGGDFPRILPNLTSLQYLSLSYNHFKSRFPSDMTGLHNLVIFDADENSFVGNFPTSLFTIPSLTRVFLADNQLKGPLEFANISSSSSKLEYVYLASNNFYGPIPDLISRFPNLSILDLSHNSFTGPIPKSISKLASLFSLDLSYNKLEGQVQGFLWRLHSLTLSHNSFSSLREPVEVDLDGKHYDLGSNSLQGLFPQWVCKFTSLELLDLSNNHLIGSIPQCLKNSTLSLETLNLGNNNFSGILPDIFMNATRLQSLDVSHNQLVGKIPKSLIYTSLEFLNLKGNKIKDTFPSWLQSLRWLRVLLLGSNEFYGPICSPSTFSGFSTLRIIDISHNSFNGTLPPDYFANWLEMYSVWMDEEELEMHSKGGGAPYWLYMEEKDSMDMMYKGSEMRFPKILLAYKAIDFSGNKFTGHIPESIGMLTEVLHLNLSGNAFTGNIPSSLANITNLEALDLSRNKLSGLIPRDLGNLSFLSYMDFSHNLLQGPVPRSTQFQRQNCSSFEDNLKLYALEEICEKIHVPDAISKQPEDFSCETDQVLNWKAAAIAYGPGVFCGLVIGHIFASQKQKQKSTRTRSAR